MTHIQAKIEIIHKNRYFCHGLCKSSNDWACTYFYFKKSKFSKKRNMLKHEPDQVHFLCINAEKTQFFVGSVGVN